MKRLFLIALVLLFLAGCSKAYLATPNYAVNAENGNKIYAYQDVEPEEKTTIMIIRVEGEDSVKEMAKMMGNVERILTGSQEEQ